ncbi:hypothetical protein KEM48_000418 [Puccinia striiformis f. sp. tritici PST-130]|nr:hypothetical protein KEM48_000418 [Puccinia striiformis f. sp. tritici PST-130]
MPVNPISLFRLIGTHPIVLVKHRAPLLSYAPSLLTYTYLIPTKTSPSTFFHITQSVFLFGPSSSYQLPTFLPHCPVSTFGRYNLNSPLNSQSTSLAALQSPPTSMKGSFGPVLGFFISLPRVFPAYFSAGLHPSFLLQLLVRLESRKMVAIKSFAQLSLSRPSSQPAAQRATSDSLQSPTEHAAVPNLGLGATLTSKDANTTLAHPINLKVAWNGNSDGQALGPPVTKVSTFSSNKLTVPSKAQALASSTPTAPPHLSATGALPNIANPIALHQLEASYVSKVGTRLRDLIDQVFPSALENGLVWNGRGAPKPSAAIEVIEALKHELEVCSCDSYIFRSLFRTAAIPALTVFAGRLDSLLILPANESSVAYVPKSVKEADHSLPVAYATISKATSGIRGYEVEIKKQVTGCILKYQPAESSTPPPAKGHLSLSRTIPSLGGYGTWMTAAHPHEPLRELINLLEGIRKVLFVKLACGAESQRWMVSVATQAVWKGMLVFATSAFPLPTQAPQSSRTSQATSATHSNEGYLGLRGARHILHTGKRSPSPPLKPEMALHQELVQNLKVFSVAISDFVKDIAGIDPRSANSSLSCAGECNLCAQGFSVNPGDDGDLVREAMNEALEALSALQLVASSLLQPDRLRNSLIACTDSAMTLSSSLATRRAGDAQPACPTLTLALKELPPFILLHLIGSRISKDAGFRLPHDVWGISWADYQEELKGFVAAERWLPEVAHEMAQEVRRIQRLRSKTLEKFPKLVSPVRLKARLIVALVRPRPQSP